MWPLHKSWRWLSLPLFWTSSLSTRIPSDLAPLLSASRFRFWTRASPPAPLYVYGLPAFSEEETVAPTFPSRSSAPSSASAFALLTVAMKGAVPQSLLSRSLVLPSTGHAFRSYCQAPVLPTLILSMLSSYVASALV